MSLTPKNWQSFQHYKNRSPIWIKLHRSLLDNFEFQCLPVASRALAPFLWLLASEWEGGNIKLSKEAIAFRFRMSTEDFEKALIPLIDKGFFSCASKTLARRKQDAMPEKEKDPPLSISEDLLTVSQEARSEIVALGGRRRSKRAVKTFLPDDWMPEGGVTDRQAPELKKIRDWAKSNAARKADWPATWRNWLRREGIPEDPPSAENEASHKGFYAVFTSAEREAWDAYARSIGVSYPVDKRGGWEFPTRWPPNYSEEQKCM